MARREGGTAAVAEQSLENGSGKSVPLSERCEHREGYNRSDTESQVWARGGKLFHLCVCLHILTLPLQPLPPPQSPRSHCAKPAAALTVAPRAPSSSAWLGRRRKKNKLRKGFRSLASRAAQSGFDKPPFPPTERCVSTSHLRSCRTPGAVQPAGCQHRGC